MGYDLNITTRKSGPLFRGVLPAELDAAKEAVQKEVAGYAELQWQTNMDDSFQNATGRYQSHVNILRREGDLVVNDGYPGSGLLYGPWLEGVGSRNQTTRFKGYFSMRRARNQVGQKVAAIAKPIIDAFIAKANGV